MFLKAVAGRTALEAVVFQLQGLHPLKPRFLFPLQLTIAIREETDKADTA